MWNFTRITASDALVELSKSALDKKMLSATPPPLAIEKNLPLNLPREQPAILATGEYSGLRPHVYVSTALSTSKASMVANKGLWSLISSLYLDPRYDRSDLSDWIDEGLAFSLVFVSQKFLTERAEGAITQITDPEFTPNKPDTILGLAALWSLGYESLPGLR